jgi:hypothetical protein
MWPYPLAEVDELVGRCLDGASQLVCWNGNASLKMVVGSFFGRCMMVPHGNWKAACHPCLFEVVAEV